MYFKYTEKYQNELEYMYQNIWIRSLLFNSVSIYQIQKYNSASLEKDGIKRRVI